MLFRSGFIGNISQNKYEFQPADRYTKFGTLSSVREFKVYFDGQEKDLFRTFFGAANLTYKFTDLNSITFRASAFRSIEEVTYDIMGQYWLNDSDDSSSDQSSDSGDIVGVGSYMEHARNYLSSTVQSYSITGQSQVKSHRISWGLEIKNEQIKERMREWEMRDSANYSLPHVPEGPDRKSVV